MAAAVADFRPATRADHKLERGAGLTLELEPTPDVLGQIARLVHGTDRTGDQSYAPVAPAPVLVGFAAETGSLDRAADKLRRKGVDLLVANDVASPARASGPTPTGSASWPPTGRATTCRCSPSARSPTPSSTGWPRALDARDAAAQTGALT